ncbi:MAG: phosphoribosylglycinamide synthetase [Deltaproteobacteria bacterium HGW-Deltaproteobacteria-2]|jgi:biotin carboxylase|nr:MAG: phosphoribosylglycinamide synthetase [Deltaproteobacteria bacterium HGW-Deltaproteobacteria-2]
MKNKKKKLLLAGGGYADIPLILSAKKLGYYVITSGNRPDELGHKYSDEYKMADFSDCEAILKLANNLKVSAICACCNDFSALSAAYTAEKLGLPGHDPYKVARVIHYKDQYRQFAFEHGIAAPKAISFTNKKDALEGMKSFAFPVIIKPVDLTGGKGMSTINEITEAEMAIEKALAVSRMKRAVAEEFISGSRHGFSVFLVDCRVVFFFSDNEHYFLNPYLVSAASVPGIVPQKAMKTLCAESEKIASLLSLKTGIFHIQYILRGEEPIIIEICRRAPGDLYIKLVEHATGVDYPSWIVKSSAGLDCSGLTQVEPKGFFTRHCVMSATAGRVRDILFDDSIKEQIIDKFMWWEKGDVVSDVMTTKFGIVFLKFQSQDEMMEKTEHMQELIRVVTE